MEFRHGCALYVICIIICLLGIEKVLSNAICPHGFTFIDPNPEIQSKNPVCIAFFKTPQTWEKAFNVCRHFSSYLFYYDATNIEHITKYSNETDEVHIGVRRTEGVYLWSDPNPKEFSHDNTLYSNELNLLWKNGEPRLKCVVINLFNKELSTVSCNETLRSFVCVGNTFPDRSLLCEDDWEFSYLSGNCIKRFSKSANYASANQECKKLKGEVISRESSIALTPAFLFERVYVSENDGVFFQVNISSLNFCSVIYWNGNSSHVSRTNCNEKRYYICQKEAKNIDIQVYFAKDNFPATSYSEFRDITMILKVKMNGKKLDNREISKIVWWKDDRPIEGCIKDSCIPALYVNTPDVTKQGRYYASVTIPGYPSPVFSKTIELYLSNISTYLLTVTGKTIPYNRTKYDASKLGYVRFRDEIVKDKLDDLFHDFSIITNLPKPTWNLENIVDSAKMVTLQVYLYLNFTNAKRPDGRHDVFISFRNFIYNKVRRGLFTDWALKKTPVIVPVGDCFEETGVGSNNINITFHDTYHGTHIVSTPPCITDQWELVTRTCHGGYRIEAKWDEFDYSKCSRRNHKAPLPAMNSCRSNYKHKKYDTCIAIYEETADWFQAQSNCSQDKGYLFTTKITSNFSLQEFPFLFEMGEMWLGGYRYSGIFQWLAFYPGLINTDEDRIIWGPGEPKSINNCLSGRVTGKTLVLYSRPCDERKPFVCMHKELGSKFYSNPRCPDNWKSWPFLEDNCYTHTNIKQSWSDARRYCNEQEGNMVVLQQNMQNFVAEKYILQLNEQPLWWIGLQRSRNGFVWENADQNIYFVDWDRTTNFSLYNSAGCLKAEDGHVSWFLANPNEKHFGICEKKARRGRALSQVVEIEKGRFRCVSDRRYYKSIIWYKDGLAIEGTRGLMDADDEYLTSMTLRPLKSTSLNANGRLQGYYWCEIDQETPFVSVASNKELYEIKAIWTFSVDLSSRKILNPFDQSTSKFRDKCEEISKKIEQNLLPKVPYTSSAFVHRMVIEGKKTTMNIYIYVLPVSKKKRSEARVSKKDYMMMLENYMKDKLSSSVVIEELQLIPEELKIKISGSCYQDITTVSGRNLTWNETRSGKLAIAGGNCVTENGDPVIRRCLGNFTYGSYWGPVEGTCSGVLSNITLKLIRLSEEEVSSAKGTSKNLKILTNSSSELKAIDLHYVALTMQKLAKVPTHQRDDVDDIISTMDNIMNMDPNIIISSKITVNASSRITASLESILENNIDKLATSTPNLVVYSWPLRNLKAAGIMVMPSDNDSLGLPTAIMDDTLNKNRNRLYEESRAGIILPLDLVHERSLRNSSIDFVIYKNDSLFISEKKSLKVINSPVLHAHISGGAVLLEEKTIEIVFETFQKPNQIPNSEKCVYWDYSLGGGEGGWSDLGCEKKSDNKFGNRIRCYCDHMTNFAILVDLYGENVEDENHAIALDIITYIGCTLSIFGLLLTIITFMIFKKLRMGLGSQVLCNLAISLLLTLIVFISGIDQTSSKAGCIFVAALLHYLLLVSFSWMLVEAVLQYLRFVKVIGTYIPKFILKASLCAWGIPLLITMLILAIDHNMYHGGKNYCWLKLTPFYYGFLAPVAIIMVSNITIFCLVIYSISCGRQKGLRSNQSERKLAITRLRAAFCILFLLGLSWTFGFFSISDARYIFKYLFSIFTTLQGFFIFVFHVLQEKTTRDLWYDYLCLKKEHGIQIFATRDTSSAKDTITSSSTLSRNKSSN